MKNVFEDKNPSEFHKLADELLENICEMADNLVIEDDGEAEYQGGVLSIKLGDGKGKNKEYVINKHEVTRQIWVSSPFSGAGKYSFDGISWKNSENSDLEKLISDELKAIYG